MTTHCLFSAQKAQLNIKYDILQKSLLKMFKNEN